MNDLELAAYLDRRLQGAERDRAEAHLAGCAECREELNQSYLLTRRIRRPLRIALAGLITVAAALLLLVRTGAGPASRSTEDSLLRQGDASAAVVAYAPMGETARGAVRFVWARVPAATTYHLTLSRVDGATLWSASTTDTALALPDSIALTPGVRYLWVADALLASGQTRSTGLREFLAAP